MIPLYGSNRLLAEHVGKALEGCSWVGILFGGGMCELPYIKARTVVVADLHAHIINLAATIADSRLADELRRILDTRIFHPRELAACQQRCQLREASVGFTYNGGPDLQWAVDYYVCCWMSRSATAGTASEFEGGLALRWNASGGDSAVRYRSAIESIAAWHEVAKQCTFCCEDVFDFLKKVHDEPGHGLYADPPFPGPGDKYKHAFTEAQHSHMSSELLRFKKCRVVMRFYDHPLVRKLYPEALWNWRLMTGGKTQTNAAAPEVLLQRN